MKRCPQCEFVYEDDQTLCDMDGILLVFDEKNLPKPRTSAKSQWRSRAVSMGAALVLGTVLFLVYYVSTHQYKASRAIYTPTPASGLTPATTNGTSTTAIIGGPAEAVLTDEKSAPEKEVIENVGDVTTNRVTDSAVKSSTEKSKSKPVQRTRNATHTKEEDSKVGTFFKKTGRMLKKPFKL